MKQPKLSQEDQFAIALLYAAGEPPARIAREFGTSSRVVVYWGRKDGAVPAGRKSQVAESSKRS